MHRIAAFIIVYLVEVTGGRDVNYCGAKMCGYTNAHTLCQFSSGPSPSCTALIPASLTSDEKFRILSRLNTRRNDAASGKLRGLPSAGNMLKLRWVEDLAREAELWAYQCRPQRTPEEHDACRDLYSISVGQCVASVVGESPGLRVESMVDIWFMQSKYFKGNVTLYEPPESNKRFYGDFAQIMWARTFMVGCGRSRFMSPVNGRLRTIERLVCNFAPEGPIPYRSLWIPGVPATACPSRSRPCGVLTSLCDYQKEFTEPKDIDASMTIEDHILLNSLFEVERNETLFDGSLEEIYLTYLAIVTMQTTDITTSHYNSMQKRDIDDKNYNNDREINKVIERFPTIRSTSERSKKLLPKKFKIIGRPKAYRIEELSNTGGDHKHNNHGIDKAVLKQKRDFYYDYSMDTLNDNVTITTTGKVDINDQNENYTFEDHKYEMIPLSTNSTTDIAVSDDTKPEIDRSIKTKIFQFYSDNDTASNGSINIKDNTVDDYLNDPETMRQLQEALDRMEHKNSNTSSSTKKTRRDIQESEISDEQERSVSNGSDEPVQSESFTILDPAEISSTILPIDNGKNSSDSAPVLSMMLKYMPYLKQYENDVLGSENKFTNSCPLTIFDIVDFARIMCVSFFTLIVC